MPAIIKHYHNLQKEHVYPYSILIPLRYETDENKYFSYGSGDDFLQNEDYTRFWGVFYDPFEEIRDVYDLAQSMLLNTTFTY